MEVRPQQVDEEPLTEVTEEAAREEAGIHVETSAESSGPELETIQQACRRHSVLISNEDYQKALLSSDEGTLDLIEALIEEDLLPKAVGCRIWSDRIGKAYVDPLATVISEDAVSRIPMDIARKAHAMPLYEIDAALTVAMTNPHDEQMIKRLEAIADRKISPVFCLQKEVHDAIQVNYSSDQSVEELIDQLERSQGAILSRFSPDDLLGMSGHEKVVSLVDTLLLLAVKERASDIHVEPRVNVTNIRFRVDGRLLQSFRFSAALHGAVKTRVKIMCGLDIAESRMPQDGRLSMPLGTAEVNFRVSFIPTVEGEKIVLRLLAMTGTREQMTLEKMQVSHSILEPFRRIIRSPNGIIFVTGPTGSGKTTTLYAALHEINTPEINISTIEDPVEIKLEGIIQTQVHGDIKLDFARLLRSLLRQDPDVILVGEIRDLETAKIATEAALTGHLVFSTLHTNNAIQAIVRLVEIGIEPYMVAPSILAVMAQRLGARICNNCKEAYNPARKLVERYFYDAANGPLPMFYQGTGCHRCVNTGYRGRIAFHELALVSDEMRSLISKHEDELLIAEAAARVGYKPLHHDGMKKVLLGFTTVEEVEKHAAFDLTVRR